jgi:hypothetical protein
MYDRLLSTIKEDRPMHDVHTEVYKDLSGKAHDFSRGMIANIKNIK